MDGGLKSFTKRKYDARPQTEVSFEKREMEKPQSRFIWDDIKFLEQQAIGLRHVPTLKRLAEESADGFNGDALALANVAALMPADFLPVKVRDLAEQYGVRPSVSSVESYLDDTHREWIIDLLQKAVLDFVKAIYDSFLGIELERVCTTKDVIEKIKTHNSFLVVRNPRRGDFAYDTKQYFGLGKFGRQSYLPHNILAKIGSDQIIAGLNLTDEELNEVISESFFDRISQSVLELLIVEVGRNRIASQDHV